MSLWGKAKQGIVNWLMKEPFKPEFPQCDFERMKYELRPCDVLLFEGRSRVSEMIKLITQSPWSHAAIYIGKIHDIDNPLLRERVLQYYNGSLNEPLVIESMLGKGTIVSSLENYYSSHIRICRPVELSRKDADCVIEFSIGRLGMEYGIRQNIDLARLMFPWGILPRRWRSTLFRRSAGTPTQEICSSMIAEAFSSVSYPILPVIRADTNKKVRMFHRNPQLYTPRDFDYSPYFKIIKYPFITISQDGIYRKLPWGEGVTSEHEQTNQSANIKEKL
jgi:Permuted papain-like amidase enzyme, YaeF/YiiX, C92 family